jgi:hypothetical protein
MMLTTIDEHAAAGVGSMSMTLNAPTGAFTPADAGAFNESKTLNAPTEMTPPATMATINEARSETRPEAVKMKDHSVSRDQAHSESHSTATPAVSAAVRTATSVGSTSGYASAPDMGGALEDTGGAGSTVYSEDFARTMQVPIDASGLTHQNVVDMLATVYNANVRFEKRCACSSAG